MLVEVSVNGAIALHYRDRMIAFADTRTGRAFLLRAEEIEVAFPPALRPRHLAAALRAQEEFVGREDVRQMNHGVRLFAGEAKLTRMMSAAAERGHRKS